LECEHKQYTQTLLAQGLEGAGWTIRIASAVEVSENLSLEKVFD
jgi:hypothetical protein